MIEDPGVVILRVPCYTTVLSQCISPNNEFLVVGDDIGRISLIKLKTIFEKNNKDHVFYQFRPHKNNYPVYTVIANQDYLITGSVGEICGWPWKNLLQKNSVKPSWSIELSPIRGSVVQTEVNCMVLKLHENLSGHLVVAGGDNLVHIFDVETRSLLRTLPGHTDYVHSVAYCPNSDVLASAGEDGAVLLWDSERSSRANTACLVPHKRSELSRPSLGKWISALDVRSNWLVCGGGPCAALWHLRTMTPVGPLPPSDKAVNVATFAHDRVVIGGHINRFFEADFSCRAMAEIESTSSCLYSIVIVEDTNFQFLSAAGSSSNIDICTNNFSFKKGTISIMTPKASVTHLNGTTTQLDESDFH